MAVVEGDIVIGTVEEVTKAASAGGQELTPRSIGITGQQFRWPNATIPFEIDPALPDQDRVFDAITHWKTHTRIRFEPRNAGNAALFPDFVRFVPGGGCSSRVGRLGGMQLITLGDNCTAGNAIHEIGHTVGLWHEQSREDRDQFISIDFSNIAPEQQHNFLQQISDGDDIGPYDYGSIMHYPPNAFAIDASRPTITAKQPLPPGVVMGQRTGLSPGDLAGVQALYPTVPVKGKEIIKDPVHDVATKNPAHDILTKNPAHDFALKLPAHDIPTKNPAHDIPTKIPAHDFAMKVPGQELMSPADSPFVLATPHQSPALTGQSDGLVEQVRQLTQLLGSLQQGLAAVTASHQTLVTQLGPLLVGSGSVGQMR
ncbi:M12 family metallopeptidase [Streptomyces gilvosporeus]|uniref:Peptidase M12A domain-containing protein n=1 Tax=Streptomyces gilvosporeus TaxID=553510 RepID=A0A1V0TLF4_9ACTN|nr:M12 family metallopeptidase [Streptomyces gilvosporeus]ARF53757.1 hypothetical protein B1H19_05825 [Streptomyces gilvosporeus]